MLNRCTLAMMLFSVMLLLPACSTTALRIVPTSADVTLMPGDGKVGTYVSSWKGFRTSSYWIEGPEGLILIDTQFLLSAAEEMVDWAEKATGKKAVLAIILHPNPDKFNGTEVLQSRGIKVVTSEQVLALIPAVHTLRSGWFYERFKPDYPSQTPRPESFGKISAEIPAAGLQLKAYVMGAGCSQAHVVIQYEDHVFVGDLVTIGFHSWLELGLIEPWLERIEDIKNLSPKFVHTGRGGTGDFDSLKRQTEYLETVQQIVQNHKKGTAQRLDETNAKAILTDIIRRYPSYDYPNFVSKGLDRVWANSYLK